MFDLLVRNGTLILEDASFPADIAVADGTVKALLAPGTEVQAGRVVDASDLLILPGLIDAHMHVQAPFQGVTPQLAFFRQSVCAAFAGVTTFMDFTNSWKGKSVVDAFDERLEEMAESAVDYAVHGKFVEARDDYLNEIKKLADKGCPTFKLFMTYRKEGVMADDETLLKIFAGAREYNCLPMVHAESNAIAEPAVDRCIASGDLGWRSFARCKPVLCETEAFARAVHFAEYARSPLLVAHTTNGLCLGIAERAQDRGQIVHVETCPHYLTLFDNLYDDPATGHLAICSPPLRTPKERDELWQGIKDGVITLIGSDDCTFTRAEKEFALQRDAAGNLLQDFTKVVNGLSGLEIRFALMVTEGVAPGRITINQAVALCSANVAKISGCYPRKGTLLPGADADMALFDPNEEWVIGTADLHSGSDFCLHEGYRAKGRVKATFVRGQSVMENGVFTGTRGQGTFIRRTL